MADSTVELNLSEINKVFAKAARGLRDATDLMGLIGEELTLAIDDRFRNEEDPDGSPWADLPPKYVAWKQRNKHSPKILQMRGDMRGRVAYKPFPDSVRIGTDVPYSGRQHKKRPFLYTSSGELGASDVKRIEKVAEDYLKSLVK